ncbi:hypothetical protein SSABA_v1c04360 [Spiroplasma sabaudiense Ar-1343]|uniref:Helicase C-terminal domain-containing protein n=1 Tax=Spiroplasma sabaudiense Ar-1343 TaxID=1276257 RepID=W6A9L6_9MOLU|nr:hypothetical protein [Spiroplasma sabaudiense]AHI53843.1 hypothetical protein SSABA_v1c04360 [Spiroplasma sabaudiense Ar-1343]
MNKGIGIHKSETDDFTRNIIESEFKNKNIKYLFCSSTLLQGVNLNTKYLFIIAQAMPNTVNKNFQQLDSKNLLGRIGRIDTYPHGFGFYINNKMNNPLKEAAINDDFKANETLNREFFLKNEKKYHDKLKLVDNFIQKITNDNNFNSENTLFDKRLVNKEVNTNVIDYFITNKVDSKLNAKIKDLGELLNNAIQWLFSNFKNIDDLIFNSWLEQVKKIYIQDKFNSEFSSPYIQDKKYFVILFLLYSINEIYEVWNQNYVKPLSITLFNYISGFSVKTMSIKKADYFEWFNNNNSDEKYVIQGNKIIRSNKKDNLPSFNKENNSHMTKVIDSITNEISNEIEYKFKSYITHIAYKVMSEKEIEEIFKKIQTLTGNEKLIFLIENGVSKQFAKNVSTDNFDECFYNEKNEILSFHAVIKNIVNKKDNSKGKEYINKYLRGFLNNE